MSPTATTSATSSWPATRCRRSARPRCSGSRCTRSRSICPSTPCCSSSARAAASPALPPARCCRSLVPKERLRQRRHLGRDHLPDRQRHRPHGRRPAVYARAIRRRSAGWQRRARRLRASRWLMLCGFLVLVGCIRAADVARREEGLQRADRARRPEVRGADQAAAGLHLAGSLCRAAGRRGRADADLRARRAARRAQGPRPAARHAQRSARWPSA